MGRRRPGPDNGESRSAPPRDRVRRRGERPAPEVELSEEELRALADEGVDPDEVRQATLDDRRDSEASDHDRDTARDEIEGLAAEHEDDY